MAKKKKKPLEPAQTSNSGPAIQPTNDGPATSLVSPRALVWLSSGILIVALGFVVLHFSDPAGQNAASILSPLLLTSGYAAIAIALSAIE